MAGVQPRYYPWRGSVRTRTPGRGGSTITTPGRGGGGPTTTTPGGGGGNNSGNGLVLILSINKSPIHVVVEAKVCNAITGSPVTITFNGQQVAAATADQAINCSSGFALPSGRAPGVLAALGPAGRLLSGRLQAADTMGVQTTFTVPDAPAGDYLVCAQSPGKDVACTNYTVTDSASVLGTSFSGGNGAAPLVSATNPNSFLAFTGMGLLRLVVLALVLIAVGGYLVRRNNRNRRHHHRRPRTA